MGPSSGWSPGRRAGMGTRTAPSPSARCGGSGDQRGIEVLALPDGFGS